MIRGAGAGDASGPGTARSLLAGIDLASPLGVGASIHWVLQHVLQRHTLRPAPRQCPLGRPLSQADPEWDSVLHQIAQERLERAEVIKLAKDQPDHVLDLFVRIIAHLTSSATDLPTRERQAEGAPPGLLPGALIQAWLEEMPLCLTHGALESQPHAIIVLTRIIDAIQVGD
jgi:hypothetical protein